MAFGVILIGMGLIFVAVGVTANRYHAKRFQEHMENIHMLNGEDQQAIQEEIEAFRSDGSIDIAISLMWLDGLGIALTMFGILLLLL